MTSLVYFKFKSNLTKQNIPFEGSAISVNDLKNAIRMKNGMKSNDFELILMTTDGKDYGEKDLIPAYSSVIVKRVPVFNIKRVNKTLNPENFKRNDPYKLMRNNGDSQNFKIINLATSDMTEDQKEDFVAELSSKKYTVAKRMQTGPAPPNYLCNRCNLPGHWIKDCPGIADKNGKMLEAKSVKRPSGIPTSNLAEVDSTTPNSYLTADGRYVVNKRNHEAYLKGKKDKRPFSMEENPPRPAPVEVRPACLVCGICDEIFRNPISTPCCGKVYCKNCAIDTIFDDQNDSFHKCPNCKEVLNVLASLTDQILLGEIINQWQIKKMCEGGLPITATIQGHANVKTDEDDDLTNDIFGFSDKENGAEKLMLTTDTNVYAGLNDTVVTSQPAVSGSCLEAGSRLIPVLNATRRDGSYGRGHDFGFIHRRRDESRTRGFSSRRRRICRRRRSSPRRRRRERSDSERSRSKRRKSRSTKERVSSSIPHNEKSKDEKDRQHKHSKERNDRKKHSNDRDTDTKKSIKVSADDSVKTKENKAKTVDTNKDARKQGSTVHVESSSKSRDRKRDKESKKCDTEGNSGKKVSKPDDASQKEVVSTTVSDKKRVSGKGESSKHEDRKKVNKSSKTEASTKERKKSNSKKDKEGVCDGNFVDGGDQPPGAVEGDKVCDVSVIQISVISETQRRECHEEQEVGTTIHDLPDTAHSDNGKNFTDADNRVVSSTMEECAESCDKVDDNKPVTDEIKSNKMSSEVKCRKSTKLKPANVSSGISKKTENKASVVTGHKRKVEIEIKETVGKRVRTKSPVKVGGHDVVTSDIGTVETVSSKDGIKEKQLDVVARPEESDVVGTCSKKVHIKSPIKEVVKETKVERERNKDDKHRNRSHSDKRKSEKDKTDTSKEGKSNVEGKVSLSKERRRHSSVRSKDKSRSRSRHRRSKHRKKDKVKKRDESKSRSRSKTRKRKHISKKDSSHRKKSKDRSRKKDRSRSKDRVRRRRRRSSSSSGSKHRRTKHRRRSHSSEAEKRHGSRSKDRKKHSKRRRRRTSTESSDISSSSSEEEEYVRKSRKKTKKHKTRRRHGKKSKKSKHKKKRH